MRLSAASRAILVQLFLSVPLGAVTIRVPSEFPTIQEGLNALSAGDTVLVSMGEYVESLTAPPFRFWLIGDVAVDTGDFPRPVIDVSLTPDSVEGSNLMLPFGSHGTVERMRFRNRQDMSQRGPGGVVAACDSAEFLVCSFDSCNGAVVWAQHDSVAHWVALQQCRFRGRRSYVYLPLTNVRAADCSFTDVLGTWVVLVGSGSRIENCHFREIVGVSIASHNKVDVTVRGCVFGPFSSNNVLGILELRNVSATIENNIFAHIRSFWTFIDLETDPDRDAVVSENTFYDCNYAGSGSGGQLLHVYAAAPHPSRPYYVERNIMAACTLGDYARGIMAEDYGFLNQNRLYDLEDSPNQRAPAIHTDNADQLFFRENLIYHIDDAMQADLGQTVDARWNWWGDSTGPYSPSQNPDGQGGLVQGNVNFTPWYADTSFLSVPNFGKPLPEQFLCEAYPNPFNNVITFRLTPPEPMIVRVELFDILGRRVKEIWSGPLAFQKQITFDGSDLASGIYFARVWQPIGNHPLAMTKLMLMK